MKMIPVHWHFTRGEHAVDCGLCVDSGEQAWRNREEAQQLFSRRSPWCQRPKGSALHPQPYAQGLWSRICFLGLITIVLLSTLQKFPGATCDLGRYALLCGSHCLKPRLPGCPGCISVSSFWNCYLCDTVVKHGVIQNTLTQEGTTGKSLCILSNYCFPHYIIC